MPSNPPDQTKQLDVWERAQAELKGEEDFCRRLGRQVGHAFTQWLNQRLPFLGTAWRHMRDYPMPAVNWWWTLGACLMMLVGLMVVSGLFLAANYNPALVGAFSSVQDVNRHVPWGWLVRNSHAAGASLLFALLYLHMLRGLFYGSYRAPRELVWWSGLVMMLAFMLTAFAGYVLPWGQMSYWGAEVITSAVRSLPGVGQVLAGWLLGHDNAPNGLGAVALRRFYLLHVVMGFVLCGLTMVHVVALHGVGSSNPTLEGRHPDLRKEPFWPRYALRDLLACTVTVACGVVLACLLPMLVYKSENLLPANALKTPEHIAPEWYLAPWFAMLRAIPSELGGLTVAAGSILVLFALPFLDGSCPTTPTRLVRRLGWGAFAVAFLVLAVAGEQVPSALGLALSRVALVVWFAVPCLVVPLCAWLDKRCDAGQQTPKLC
ncbi:cytochrome b [Formicincola oecophyllae]|uniref:Cytochrome b n=1 Tax=Formicincola oecophyllae TaxID=2558361 RepID=A0A4Y6U7J6_9PROT|nr:cytochrome b N-terminal domain-containing protein [Formicincola oecophyllae]QDH13292.1 cytochrome b [Formicincola oecophyllae]